MKVLHNLQGQPSGLHNLICFLNSLREGTFFMFSGMITHKFGPVYDIVCVPYDYPVLK